MPALVSVYVVDEVPEFSGVVVELKLPVLLLDVHVIVPVGLEPDTVAVQVIGESVSAGFGEQETDVVVGRLPPVIVMIAVTEPELSEVVPVLASSLMPRKSSPDCPQVNVFEAPTM